MARNIPTLGGGSIRDDWDGRRRILGTGELADRDDDQQDRHTEQDE